MLPFSEVELCQISLDEGDLVEAKKHLDAASTALKVKKNGNSLDANIVQPSPIASWHEGLADAGAPDNGNPFDADYDPITEDADTIITFKTSGFLQLYFYQPLPRRSGPSAVDDDF
ncbi:unnamed protein product [Dibothriocephalus latus]|uniref:Uncharacterized protein n=1 Tax=Dibothriocephalus latus TaxID=60516 RepID=A0A3P7MT59_DIBLA|nr:unnamed protein product [Dibothriocephalus latus]